MATILVIDDHATNRELLKTILEYQGHHVLEAGDARDGLKVAQARRPDLIISDILMPTMDGFEFVRELRDDPTIATTPVVLSSAHYLSREATNLAEACGVVHILPKPLEPETVLQIVELALASRSIRRPAVSNEFTREHARVVSDKLAEKVEELRTTNQRLTNLNELVREIGSEPSSHGLLESFCRGIRGVVGARFAGVGIIDETGRTQIPLIFSGMLSLPTTSTEEVAGPDSLIGKSLTTRQCCRAADLVGDPRVVGLPAAHPRVRFALCAPIASPSCTYGWICLSEKVGIGRFSEEDEELLGSLAAQVGRAYENNVLLTRLQQRAAELEREVAEHKRTEQALRESEARYRTVGEAIPYGVWICNSKGGVEYVSHSFLDLVGKILDEVKPRGWLDRLPPEDVKPTLEAWHACVRAGGEWTWEHRVKGTDGIYRTILSLGRPVRNEQGRITSWVGFNLDISERKRAEDALRESEIRFRGTFENAAVGIANVGRDGTWLRVNQRLCEILGYSHDELLQKNFREMTHPEDLPFNLDRFSALMRGEIDTYHLEKRYLHKDGHAVWVNLTSAVQRDHAGNPAYCIAIIENISARKRAEEALRESEIRMRALLDASQDEILLVSIDGEVLAINKAATRRLARRMGGADPVGASLDRLLPEDQAEKRMEFIRQVAATATLAHWEVQIRSRWFEFWFYPVLPPDGVVREVAVYAREITEQKQYLAELSKLSQAIQQSPMSVVITDRNGLIEYVNPEFTKVTGYTMQEAIGQNPRLLKSGHTPPEFYAELWNTIAGGGPWRGELLNRRKNGELFWELASIAPVKEGETITNFVAVKEDITNRKETEEQLRQSQKMQAVGQLTGGIAHDFNNLLAIIMGNLQLLEMRVGDDAKAREFLDDALWSARRGGELTRRLLAFARKQSLKPTVIDLNDVVRDMTELLRRTLGADVRIEELLASNLWRAVADRGELERAVVNLAVNARDAMQGAGTLTLETRNALLDEDYAEQFEEVTPGDYVLLAITDTGAGMTPETMQRVFEPFFTTKETGQGSGLGLSMVYGFVKQSGGHISIYSRIGHGTSVKLYLPRAATSDEQPKDSSSEEQLK